MPVEIRELHIRVAVTAPPAAPAQAGGAAPGGTARDGGEQARQTLVAECVEQVLQVLNRKAER